MKCQKEIKFEIGNPYKLYDVVIQLDNFGYEKVDHIIDTGQFSVLGENLSIFSNNSINPIRLVFFGNNLESISSYSLKTRKKISSTDKAIIKSNILILDDGSRIKSGDYVVHIDHGIGVFKTFQKKEVSGKVLDYVIVEYLNNDKLYVPIELKEKISPYIGVGRRRPRLNKLGGKSWEKTYRKTYENIILFARKLLNLYAEREILKTEPMKINLDWNEELVKNFGYIETPDQDRVIKEVFSDLEKNIPMDRLIVGDVGFGKTEVAIRATAQACANGYQVILLAPTTVLAEQHYINLKNRFRKLPVVIEHLSRLVNSSETKRVKEGLANGGIDIVVGTHKLFHQNIKYKNLGLLVVDEEQKFGVKDKEKLKEIKKNINVLTMTATPIPRTLFMALSGIRNISQIYSPPSGRKEIDTKVFIWEEQKVKLYIKREIDRGGQVYYLYNKVETIESKKKYLKKLFPNLNIAIAHGQMGEKKLAQTMRKFTEGKVDVLVCSTIIENGIDLSNVNTLIVENADRFGLSQLYQIRGRIGRSKKQAYALFMHKDKKITSNAYKRFKSLLENTELGVGYNVALSDLEIRGGGNILGKEQHGNMESVGLVLYTKMLNKAVEKFRTKQKLL